MLDEIKRKINWEILVNENRIDIMRKYVSGWFSEIKEWGKELYVKKILYSVKVLFIYWYRKWYEIEIKKYVYWLFW